jgi:hypothetical protein
MRETMYMMGLRSDALWLSWAGKSKDDDGYASLFWRGITCAYECSPRLPLVSFTLPPRHPPRRVRFPVHFLALWVPLSLLLTACSRQLFTYSEPGYVLLYFLVFFVSTTAYGVLVATVFNQSRTAAVAGCLVYFVGFYAFQGQQNAQPTYVLFSLENVIEHLSFIPVPSDFASLGIAAARRYSRRACTLPPPSRTAPRPLRSGRAPTSA